MTSALDLEYRTYFRTLDAALADYELPLSAVDKIRDITRGLRYEHVYIPESRQYIALEPLGADKPIAFITSMYVALHPEGGESQFFELPGFADAVQAADAAAQSATAAPSAVVASGAVTEAAASPSPSDGAMAKASVASALRPIALVPEPVKPAPRVTNMGIGKRAEIAELPCPTCFIDLPATGVCDLCG
ncbi:hypothetical protein [Demequina sp. NBRC 110055]|uniref:hypothetical protein n=1 Tax=Demequina sp. NBRC 110055 TaxID=1570344 RepID=UPI0009FF2B69|nr:hypothetical protein [Demequina sp. NBRC 110055]